jgi:hypothetical protein
MLPELGKSKFLKLNVTTQTRKLSNQFLDIKMQLNMKRGPPHRVSHNPSKEFEND